jgi:uncharacterized membrane protein YfcA
MRLLEFIFNIIGISFELLQEKTTDIKITIIVIITSNALPIAGILFFDWLPGIVLAYYTLDFILHSIFFIPKIYAKLLYNSDAGNFFKFVKPLTGSIMNSILFLFSSFIFGLGTVVAIYLTYLFSGPVKYTGFLRWMPVLSENQVNRLVIDDYRPFYESLVNVNSFLDFLSGDWLFIIFLFLAHVYYLIIFFRNSYFKDEKNDTGLINMQFLKRLMFTFTIGSFILIPFLQIIFHFSANWAGAILVLYYIVLETRDEVKLYI